MRRDCRQFKAVRRCFWGRTGQQMCLPVMDISGAERRALQTWRLHPWAAKSAVSFVLRGELPFVQGCCPASGLVRLRGDRPNGGPQGACLLR